MRKLFVIAIVICSFVSKNYGQDWVTINSSDGKFTVQLPVEPTIRKDTSKTYPTYTTVFLLSKGNGEMFAIGWVDYESSYKFDEQKELEANRDNFIKGINGALVETKNTTFNGYKAIEFTATSGSFFWTSKVLLVGRRPYQLLAGSTTGHPSENENKFYNSFSIKN